MTQLATMRDALFERLAPQMARDPRITIVSADLGAPSLDRIRRDFPTRFFNVGIAEQNLVDVAAGLALEGRVVFAYAIAAFLSMRALEQIRVSLAIASQLRALNVSLLGLGAGFSYDLSGPSHHCPEDLSLMRTLPNLDVISPSDARAAAAVVDYSLSTEWPKYVRLDGKPLPGLADEPFDESTLKTGFQVLRTGRRACLVSTGYMTHRALRVATALASGGQPIGVVDMLRFGAIDEARLVGELGRYERLVTVEEGFIGRGGLDAFIQHLVQRHRLPASCGAVGLRATYTFTIESRDRLHALNGAGDEDVCAALGVEPPPGLRPGP